MDAGFDVWIDWYHDRLEGRLLDAKLERKWALLLNDALTESAGEINARLKAVRDEHFGHQASQETIPEIPESQEPGLQFAPREDGRIDLTPSGIAPPDDVAEILAMRGVIVEALDDLLILLAGSNAYPSIAQVADRYKSAISADELSVDLLYAYGVRLENSRTRLEVEIKSGDCPAMAVPAGEALDSVIALHGPVVYSTARGKELVERARAFEADGLDVSAYKSAAQQVATAIDEADEAVTKLARETIRQASDEIGEGKHPERSAQLGHTTLSNFMIAAAKGVQQGFAAQALEEGVKDGIKDGHKTIAKWGYVGSATAVGIAAYAAAPAVLSFFIANQPLLHQFSIVAGCELSWLPSFLNWLERQRARINI